MKTLIVLIGLFGLGLAQQEVSIIHVKSSIILSFIVTYL